MNSIFCLRKVKTTNFVNVDLIPSALIFYSPVMVGSSYHKRLRYKRTNGQGFKLVLVKKLYLDQRFTLQHLGATLG